MMESICAIVFRSRTHQLTLVGRRRVRKNYYKKKFVHTNLTMFQGQIPIM